jgi:uridine kinase
VISLSDTTLVIAIAGHSGAGKSTLIRHLAALLGNANTLMIDQYESSSYYPLAKEWIEQGADPNEFKFPQFDADVTALVNGQSITHPETKELIQPAPFLILEEPFGRGRDTIRDVINLVIYLDTPLEVSYIRKISRKTDFLPWEDDPELFMRHLRENMDWYLRVGRSFYCAIEEKIRKDCDLIVNGLLSTEEAVDKILKVIQQQ